MDDAWLYLGLYRVELGGRLASAFGLTETCRRAQNYRLRAVERRRLEEVEGDFEEVVNDVRATLRDSQGER